MNLKQRLEAGELDPERVRLAAWLGDPRARELTAEARLEPEQLYASLADERGTKPLNIFANVDQRFCARAAHTAARYATRELDREVGGAEAALLALAAWIDDPTEDLARAARAAAAEIDHPDRSAMAAVATAGAVRAAAQVPHLPPLTASRRATRAVRGAALAVGFLSGTMPPMPAGAPRVLEAMREALVPVLLGDG